MRREGEDMFAEEREAHETLSSRTDIMTMLLLKRASAAVVCLRIIFALRWKV